jgi:hypothetical protein
MGENEKVEFTTSEKERRKNGLIKKITWRERKGD